MHSILINQGVEEEILFLMEIKKLLNQIKNSTSLTHIEIISIIEEIYQFAVDKNIDDNTNLNLEGSILIDKEIVNLFQDEIGLEEAYLEENDDFVEEDEELSSHISGEAAFYPNPIHPEDMHITFSQTSPSNQINYYESAESEY